MPYDIDRVKDVPEEGQNIHGLFMEGGRWNRQENCLAESEPKKLFINMPIIYVTGITLSVRRARGIEYSPYGYDCAVYKSHRTRPFLGRDFVFTRPQKVSNFWVILENYAT